MCLVTAPIVFWASRNSRKDFSKPEKNDGGCGGFFQEGKLVSTNFNQIQVKQINLKDSGG